MAETESQDEEYVCPPEFESDEQMRKLFIQNIHKEATTEEVQEFFSEDTEVEKCELIKKDGTAKYFGFVTFKKCDDVDAWLKKRPLKIRDRELFCKRAVAKDDKSDTAHTRTKKIFFANCTTELTEDMIRKYMEKRHPPSKFGKIDEITIIKKKEGDKEVSKGYGFIMCESEDLVDRITTGDRKCSIDPNSNKEQEFKKAWDKEKGPGGRGGRGGGRGAGRARGGGYAQQAGGRGGGYGGGGGGYGGGYGQPYGGWGMQGWGGGYSPAYGGGYPGRPYGW